MNLIQTEEQLQLLIDQSNSKPVVIFKHSTRCPISTSADEEMKKVEMNYQDRNVEIAKIHVVEDRSVSLHLANLVNITHESPQLMILNEGKVIWNDSHYGIKAERVDAVLSKLC